MCIDECLIEDAGVVCGISESLRAKFGNHYLFTDEKISTPGMVEIANAGALSRRLPTKRRRRCNRLLQCIEQRQSEILGITRLVTPYGKTMLAVMRRDDEYIIVRREWTRAMAVICQHIFLCYRAAGYHQLCGIWFYPREHAETVYDTVKIRSDGDYQRPYAGESVVTFVNRRGMGRIRGWMNRANREYWSTHWGSSTSICVYSG